jgi:hypothetical protein
VQAKLFEAEPQHLGRRFACVAVPMVPGVEDEAELGHAVLLRPPAEVDLTEQVAGLLVFDGEDEDVALLDEGGVLDAVPQGLRGLLAGARGPHQVARHLGQLVVGVQRVEVGLGERAQQQAVGLHGVVGGQHVRQPTRPGGCGPTA